MRCLARPRVASRTREAMTAMHDTQQGYRLDIDKDQSRPLRLRMITVSTSPRGPSSNHGLGRQGRSCIPGSRHEPTGAAEPTSCCSCWTKEGVTYLPGVCACCSCRKTSRGMHLSMQHPCIHPVHRIHAPTPPAQRRPTTQRPCFQMRVSCRHASPAVQCFPCAPPAPK